MLNLHCSYNKDPALYRSHHPPLKDAKVEFSTSLCSLWNADKMEQVCRARHLGSRMLRCRACAQHAQLRNSPFRGFVGLLLRVQLHPVVLLVTTVAVDCHEDPAEPHFL